MPQGETECVECLGEKRCAVVWTRAIQKQEKETLKKNKARTTYHKWENSIRTLGQVGHMERNLLDHQYTFTLNLTLSKEVYDRWSA